MLTKSVSLKDTKEQWYHIDAAGITLGKLASSVAKLLRGKHLSNFTPHANHQQKVVVVNASKIEVTGKKLTDKLYYRHSGYVGNLKQTPLKDMLEKNPSRVVEIAIKGMLPHNKLGKDLFRNLFVYAEQDHKHVAQKPKIYKI